MRKLFTTLISCVAVAILMASSALANKTPDGETPAEETVCDPLKADGFTKGLYGLCVAFCEAQDHADVATPITVTELETLKSSIPSGRILANYNKKKQATDPAMPCIKETPCPCWSNDELTEIDGVSGSRTSVICGQGIDPVSGLINFRHIREEALLGKLSATVWEYHRLDINFAFEACRFTNGQVPPFMVREASVDSGTLTHAQAANCLAQVNAQCAAVGR